MKKIFLFNLLIISSLSVFAQNYINNSDNNNVFASNVQVNYTTSLTNVSVYTNVGGSNTNVQSLHDNQGNPSALSNLNLSVNNKIQVQQQTTNKIKKNPVIQTQVVNMDVNENQDNVFENKGGNLSNPSTNRGGNTINDVVLSNPQTTTNKANSKSVVVMEEFKGTDFKPISLSGRDYSNGGKMKKGVKNFPKMDHSKVKHKKKPTYKKVKYHTSHCAKW